MTVAVKASSGFGHMGFAAVECPGCNRVTERALPREIVEIRRS
jgi:hypothetical protein